MLLDRAASSLRSALARKDILMDYPMSRAQLEVIGAWSHWKTHKPSCTGTFHQLYNQCGREIENSPEYGRRTIQYGPMYKLIFLILYYIATIGTKICIIQGHNSFCLHGCKLIVPFIDGAQNRQFATSDFA